MPSALHPHLAGCLVAAPPSGGLDWGDVPTWVGAVATLLALLAAAYAAKQAAKVYALESARDRSAEAERHMRAAQDRQAQAASVCGWIAQVRERPGTPATRIAMIRNASPLPVYEVVARVVAADGSITDEWTLDVLPPTPDGERRPLSADGAGAERAAIALRFKDAQGASFERSASGTLIEHAPA